MQSGTKSIIAFKYMKSFKQGLTKLMSRNTILTDRHGIKYFLIVFLINLLALSPLIIFSHVHISEDAYAYLMNNDYEIEKFEVSNGVKIKKIGVCYDKTPDINAKEIYHDYDAEAIIYLHIKHPIEFVEVPKDIIQNNFAEKDWKSYDAEEQIVFDKNTAYVCVY